MRFVLAVAVWLLCTAHPVTAQEAQRCVSGVTAPAPDLDGDTLGDFATGRGVTVAVIDTGIRPHPFLGEVEATADLVSPEAPDPHFDCDGHGTAVAGVIRRLAPDARLLSIRQTSRLDGDGAGADAGSLASLADAVHLGLDHGADLINISVVACLPAEVAVRLDSRPLDEALARAEREGSVVVAAAGNHSPDCEDSSVVYPTHSDTVVGVGARATDHELADYSLPLPAGQPEFSAAGHLPAAPAPDGDGWVSAVTPPGQGPREFHGTSFAAPVVTGTAALILERHPGYSPAELRGHLVSAAHPAHGFIDPESAVTHVPGASPSVGEVRLAVDPPKAEHTRPRADTLLGVLSCLVVLGVAVVGLRRPAPHTPPRRARPFVRGSARRRR